MKKLLAAALVALTVATSSFAAGTSKINAFVLHSFKADFNQASDVTWSTGNDFAKATFIVNNQKMEAFYNLNGEMIGTSKAISLDDLSIKAKRNFAKAFGNYTVKEAIRFEGTEESAYFISAENEKESVIVKIKDNDNVSTYQKTKK